ncbi:hypothetical protein COOONC_16564 [Cooperia oncophora]
MSDPNSSHPQTVEECNHAMEAIMSKLVDRLHFESKILIHGQEDVLTLSEYEALFAADMKICENALDVVLDLARKRKSYLEAVVAARRFERSLPSTVTSAFIQTATETNKAHDLRVRLKEGDYSFFVPAYAQGDSMANTVPLMGATTIAAGKPDHSNSTESRVSSNRSTAFSSCLAKDPYVVPQIRERPQYASDAARRFLSKMETIEPEVSTIAEIETVQQEQKTTKSNDFSVGREHKSETMNIKQISSSGGCSLDGSLIVDGGEVSDQNGIRTYSPVREIPPPPNFDDTDMESFCEPIPARSQSLNSRKTSNEVAYAGEEKRMRPECPTMVLRSTENTANPILNEDVKPPSESAAKPIWLSSAYQPPRRPKFTSSVGRMFNQEYSRRVIPDLNERFYDERQSGDYISTQYD